MAKTLSAFTTTKIDSPFVDIVRVVNMEFSGITLNLCDRIWGDAGSECVFNGTLYEPLIVSWDEIRSGRINPVTYEVEPSSAGFSVLNSVSVGGADTFAKLFALYNPHFVTITISEFHVGASAAEDLEDIFKGNTEDFPEMTTDIVSVTCSGFELSITNKFAHDMVDATTYPDADPDDLGKMLPQAYGQAKRVPFMAVDAGWMTSLAQNLTAGVTGNVDFTDVSGMPSSGTIQIDAEQMTYGSKSDANNTLNISAREQNGTDDVDHDLGATVAEIQSDYFYIIGHAVKAFDSVYVEDAQGNQVLQPSGNYTAYTGQSGDEHGSYPGKACIKFTVLPILTKQINVTLSDTKDVDDAITVTDNIAYSSAGANKEIYPNATNATRGDVTNPAYAYDGNESSKCDVGLSDMCSWVFPSTNYGTIATQYLWILIETSGTIHVMDSNNVALGTINSATPQWFRFTKSGGAWSLGIRVDGAVNAVSADVFEIKKIVEYTPTLTKTGGASRGGAATIIGAVTLTGNSVADTVIGGRVSADLQAFQDDGSGTYTGTPNALIERPDHILKHIIIDRCGLTVSEIDSTTYTAAGAFYNTNSYVLAFAILQKPNSRILINEVARQAKSIEAWESGVHKLIHIPDVETTDKSLDGHRIDLEQIFTKYTDRADIKNTFSARYNRHWDGYSNDEEADRDVVTSTNSISVTKYGTLQGDSLSFPHIPGSTQAQAVLDLTKSDLRFPRLGVDFSGGHYLTDLERGDIIEFSNVTVNEGDTPTHLFDALLGLVEMDLHQFRIIDKIYAQDAIKLETIRLNPLYRKNIEGKYNILLQKIIEGKYNIIAPDDWGDGDDWGDSDDWSIG